MAVQINYSNSTVQDDGTLSNDVYIKGGCVSTDSKPTNNIAVGSELIEADTGKTYMYSGTAWVEQPSSGGGGSSNKFIVTLTPTEENYSGVMDKTLAEISAAYEANCDIVFRFITSENGSYIDIPASAEYNNDNETPYYSFHAYFVINQMLIDISNVEVEPQTNTYYPEIYALTPVS